MQDGQYISLVEVGPRDGLQSEDVLLSTQGKVDFIACLVRAGLRRIQVTSFVHPRLVPQMADAEQLIRALPDVQGVEYSALVLNRIGLERALATHVDCIEISVSASTTHSQKNTKMSRQQALAQAQDMIIQAKKQGYAVRGSVQCAFGCVYEGEIDPEVVCGMARTLLEAGAHTLALADTTGMGHPHLIRDVITRIQDFSSVPLALHLHDTLGLGLVNLVTALECGVRCFDTSCGGLGGCPFVPGAAGNIPTEDTVYLLHKLGYSTGVDWPQAAGCSRNLEDVVGRSLPAKLRAGYTV
ncbi:MAG: hydroxymethylglutaryl-CoA lyase [Desulfovermiculus sp.]|nr:hydroxymethylglutaryl-CoA lyase [Desulfovermiculus sp.]